MTFNRDSRTYVISPKLKKDVGTYMIAVVLNDGLMDESYTFTVMVSNDNS